MSGEVCHAVRGRSRVNRAKDAGVQVGRKSDVHWLGAMNDLQHAEHTLQPPGASGLHCGGTGGAGVGAGVGGGGD